MLHVEANDERLEKSYHAYMFYAPIFPAFFHHTGKCFQLIYSIIHFTTASCS